jgi:hypothetical protein
VFSSVTRSGGVRRLYLLSLGSPEALKHLGEMKSLRRLSLKDTDARDDALPLLKQFKELRSLNPAGTHLDGATLGELRALKALEELDLSGALLRQAGDWSAFPDLPALHTLPLNKTSVGDKVLKALQGAEGAEADGDKGDRRGGGRAEGVPVAAVGGALPDGGDRAGGRGAAEGAPRTGGDRPAQKMSRSKSDFRPADRPRQGDPTHAPTSSASALRPPCRLPLGRARPRPPLLPLHRRGGPRPRSGPA